MNDTYPRVIGYHTPIDYKKLIEFCDLFASRYPFLSFTYLGESILGRAIPILSVGHGARELLYVGGSDGTDCVTPAILLRFLNELCELYRNGQSLYRLPISTLCEQYTVNVIPMLNPDGTEYRLHGIDPENPLRERLLRENGGEDFSKWRGNARGAMLDGMGNGITDGIEPELGNLCNLVQFRGTFRIILSFSVQGEELLVPCKGQPHGRTADLARRISALSGYRQVLSSSEQDFCSWCNQALGIPAFTLKCGRGKPPIPIINYFPIYASLREMLFTIGKAV